MVVSITGDGGFLYGVGELATAAQHEIPLVAVVFRDDAYGNVLRMQQESTGHEIASRLQNPDLVRLAESFGVAGHRVTDLGDLERPSSARSSRAVPPSSTFPSARSPTFGGC